MSEKLFTAKRWTMPPICTVDKAGGTKQDEIEGANWALKNGVINQDKYDKRMKEIEEKFKDK